MSRFRFGAALLGLVLAVNANAVLVTPPTVDWVSIPATATVGQVVSVGVGAHANLSDNSDGNQWNAASPGFYSYDPLVIAAVNVQLQRPGETTWTNIGGWMSPWQTPATRWTSFTVNTPGTHYIQVQIMDGRPWYSSVYSYAISVPTPAPSITSQLAVGVNQGQSVSYAITATNSPTGYTATGLPAGLALNPTTGVISGAIPANGGTPGTGSTVSSTITATNSAGTDSKTLTWTITAAALSPTGSVTPATVTLGSAVTLTRSGTANFGIGWTENTIWKPDGSAQVLGNLQLGSQSYTPSPGTGTYRYQFRLVDSYANYQDQWISFTVTGVAAPTGLQAASLGSYSAGLAWNAVSGATGYNVYRDGVKLNSSPVTGASYTDATAQPGTSYTYTVKAIALDGSESPAATLAVTTAPSFEVFTPLP